MKWRVIWHTNGGPEQVDIKTFDEVWKLAGALRIHGYTFEIRQI
jgi:hypothetical protein